MAAVSVVTFLLCSGSNVWHVMAEADDYARYCALWTTAAVLPVAYYFARRGWYGLAFAHAALLLVQPSWTTSAWRGDCGYFKREASTAFVVIAAMTVVEAAAFAALQPIWARRKSSKDGFCRRCGYDLRASTKRCPECGGAI